MATCYYLIPGVCLSEEVSYGDNSDFIGCQDLLDKRCIDREQILAVVKTTSRYPRAVVGKLWISVSILASRIFSIKTY